MLLHALAPLTFSPHAAQPSRSRHAVRSRPLMREACKDTLCYSLSSAKPESVEKLGPAQLQQQIDLLQRQISIDKAGRRLQRDASGGFGREEGGE